MPGDGDRLTSSHTDRLKYRLQNDELTIRANHCAETSRSLGRDVQCFWTVPVN